MLTRPRATDLSVGDIVKIRYAGGVYSTYTSMAEAMGAKHWRSAMYGSYGEIKEGYVGRILSIKQHFSNSTMLALFRVYVGDECREYIINVDGLDKSDGCALQKFSAKNRR